MSMSPEMKAVIEFCLDHAPQATMPRQVLLYRGLAEFCSDKAEAAKFRSLANEIEATIKHSRQLAFAWKAEHDQPVN